VRGRSIPTIGLEAIQYAPRAREQAIGAASLAAAMGWCIADDFWIARLARNRDCYLFLAGATVLVLSPAL